MRGSIVKREGKGRRSEFSPSRALGRWLDGHHNRKPGGYHFHKGPLKGDGGDKSVRWQLKETISGVGKVLWWMAH